MFLNEFSRLAIPRIRGCLDSTLKTVSLNANQPKHNDNTAIKTAPSAPSSGILLLLCEYMIIEPHLIMVVLYL